MLNLGKLCRQKIYKYIPVMQLNMILHDQLSYENVILKGLIVDNHPAIDSNHITYTQTINLNYLNRIFHKNLKQSCIIIKSGDHLWGNIIA